MIADGLSIHGCCHAERFILLIVARRLLPNEVETTGERSRDDGRMTSQSLSLTCFNLNYLFK